MKKKLFAAATSLAMAFVMLTSASFAWFTVSKTSELTNIEMEMDATQNMEIAKATDETTAPGEVTANDGDDDTKWGGNVTTFASVTNLVIPAAASGTNLQTVGYTTSGRTNGLSNASYTNIGSDGTGSYSSTDGKKCAAVFGVWLRTNTAGTITASATDIKINGSAADSKAGLAFIVGSSTDLKVATVSSGSASVDLGSFTANDATLVKVILFINGDSILASDVASSMALSVGKIEFTNSAIN